MAAPNRRTALSQLSTRPVHYSLERPL